MPYDAGKAGTSLKSGFGRRHVAVTPSDSADLGEYASALFVGGAGTITFVAVDDAADTGVLWTVPAGFYISMGVRRVRATGTTATGIVAIYG